MWRGRVAGRQTTSLDGCLVAASGGLTECFVLGSESFRVPFQLTGLPVTGSFVDRDAEMEQIEHSLLPWNPHDARKVHVLHGLGGIGKTQLAIAYCRKYQKTYSAILWLNGNSEDTLLQSLAAFATYARLNSKEELTASAAGQGQETVEKAKAVRRWLALEGNRRWLVVFDNVDRDHRAEVDDSQAYDIESYFPAADHGSILITTRLPHLGLHGKSTHVSRVDSEQAFQILTENLLLPRSPGIDFQLLRS